jgi:hypothetical protein
MKSCEATGSFSRCERGVKVQHPLQTHTHGHALKLRGFILIVTPEMQARGISKSSCEEGTLRKKPFGEGARLGSRHIGTVFRELQNRFDLLIDK